jgi:hypothetical protein
MIRHVFALVTGLCLVGPVGAATWADSLFDDLSKDFGSVPRGPMLSHPFRLTNNTSSPIQIASVRVSCGCVTATAFDSVVPPGQSTVVLAQMDTRRFAGVKSVTIYVQVSQPHWEEVRLWVQANSRDDMTISPDGFTFGQVKRGSDPSTDVTVTFLGSSQWQLEGAQSESNYVQVSVKELRRDYAERSYQVSAKIRPDTPVGKWYTDIWLKTNNPSGARVRVPLTVEIQSALSVSPNSVALGEVKLGSKAERKVIVRGVKPFRITSVKGTDDELSVRDTTPDNRPLHVLAVTFKPGAAGELNRSLQVITDLKDEGEIEFQASAQVVP